VTSLVFPGERRAAHALCSLISYSRYAHAHVHVDESSPRMRVCVCVFVFVCVFVSLSLLVLMPLCGILPTGHKLPVATCTVANIV